MTQVGRRVLLPREQLDPQIERGQAFDNCVCGIAAHIPNHAHGAGAQPLAELRGWKLCEADERLA